MYINTLLKAHIIIAGQLWWIHFLLTFHLKHSYNYRCHNILSFNNWGSYHIYKDAKEDRKVLVNLPSFDNYSFAVWLPPSHWIRWKNCFHLNDTIFVIFIKNTQYTWNIQLYLNGYSWNTRHCLLKKKKKRSKKQKKPQSLFLHLNVLKCIPMKHIC